ncbi:MAG TPA: hypothetical protein VFJ18_07780 [Pararhizobium sp.]|nr:hypothetical protein [Pararhizobium sp.]
MGEVPLSLHVDAQLKESLENEARLQHVSADDLAQRAIKRYLALQERDRAIMRERIAEADKGVFISEEAMLEWMDRLEDDIDAPAPRPDVVLPSHK